MAGSYRRPHLCSGGRPNEDHCTRIGPGPEHRGEHHVSSDNTGGTRSSHGRAFDIRHKSRTWSQQSLSASTLVAIVPRLSFRRPSFHSCGSCSCFIPPVSLVEQTILWSVALKPAVPTARPTDVAATSIVARIIPIRVTIRESAPYKH